MKEIQNIENSSKEIYKLKLDYISKHLKLIEKLGKTEIKLEEDSEKFLNFNYLSCKKFLTFIRQDPELIFKIYDNAKIDSIQNIFSNLFMDNFFEDILKVNSVEDELLTLIWRALNQEFNSINSLNNIDIFLRNSKCFYLLKGINNKYEIRQFFHDIIQKVINEFAMRRNETWRFDIKSIKDSITSIDDSIKETLYYQEKQKQKQKDSNVFYRQYFYDLSIKGLEEYRNKCGNRIIEEYCNRQLNIKDKNKQYISSSLLIEEMYNYDSSEEILSSYCQSFMSVKKILYVLFKNFLDKAPIFPYSIRCVCKMIKILIEKKFPNVSPLDTYRFVSKYFFSMVFYPFLNTCDNEVYIDLIIDEDILTKIKFILKFIEDAQKGELYNEEKTICFTGFNWFLLKEFMPLYYDFFETLTHFKFSNYIEKLTSGEIKLDNYYYDYFKEYPDIQFRFFTFCLTIEDFIEIIENLKQIFFLNKDEFIPKNLNISNKDYIENRQNFLFDFLNEYIFSQRKLNRLYEMKDNLKCKSYFLITNEIYNSKMKQLKEEIESNQNCIFFTKTTNIIKENNLQSQLIIKFENLLSSLLFKDKHIQKINLENNEINNILSESMNYLKTEISSSSDNIQSFWYAQTLIPLIQKFEENNIKLEDIYSEMKIKINESINLYEQVDTICSLIINKMKNLKKIKVYLQNLINLIYEIQINHEILPISLTPFKLYIKVEFNPTDGFFEINKSAYQITKKLHDKDLFVSYSIDLSSFLSTFPNLNKILLDYKMVKVIEIQKNLEINKKIQFLGDIVFEIIQKAHPNIPPIDNIICDLLVKNMNVKQNELSNLEKLKKEIQTSSDEEKLKMSFGSIQKRIKIISNDLNKVITREKEIKEENNNLNAFRLKIKNKLEDSIFEKLYDKLFPIRQSQEDKVIYKQCFKLSWIEPKHVFQKKKYLIHKDFFTDIIDLMRQTDIERAPKKKIEALNKLALYVKNIIAFNEGNNQSGAEEFTPFLLYAIIKAKPIKMYSNLEYIKVYVENPFQFPVFGTVDGIVKQLFDDKYRLCNISEEDIKKKCDEALENYIDV